MAHHERNHRTTTMWPGKNVLLWRWLLFCSIHSAISRCIYVYCKFMPCSLYSRCMRSNSWHSLVLSPTRTHTRSVDVPPHKCTWLRWYMSFFSSFFSSHCSIQNEDSAYNHHFEAYVCAFFSFFGIEFRHTHLLALAHSFSCLHVCHMHLFQPVFLIQLVYLFVPLLHSILIAYFFLGFATFTNFLSFIL